MPRPKGSSKVKDPIYKEMRFGGKKSDPEPIVRSGGRIKVSTPRVAHFPAKCCDNQISPHANSPSCPFQKPKNIFDPSEAVLGKDNGTPKAGDRDPDKKATPTTAGPSSGGEKRRLSVVSTTSSQASTATTRTRMSSSPSPARSAASTPVSVPTKRRKVDPVVIPSSPKAVISAAFVKKEEQQQPPPPAIKEPQTPQQKPAVGTLKPIPGISISAVKGPHVLNGKLPGVKFRQESPSHVAQQKTVSLLKAKQATPGQSPQGSPAQSPAAAAGKKDANPARSPSPAKPPQQTTRISVNRVVNPSAAAVAGPSSSSAAAGKAATPAAQPVRLNCPDKRKLATYQCCVCNKFDQMDLSHWSKCSACMVNVHRTCTESSKRIGPWLCRKCVICNDCEEEVDADEEVYCNKCYTLYHLSCLPDDFRPAAPGTTDWCCQFCRPGGTKAKVLPPPPPPLAKGPQKPVAKKGTRVKVAPPTTAIAGTAADKRLIRGPQGQPIVGATVSKPQMQRNVAVKQPKLDGYQPTVKVPDASKWSADDVYNFFVERFPKEAIVFLEQEIDGVSLLLMRRTDVIQGLGFKLGPALRIYKQIIMLQTRDTDPTLTWY